MIGQHRVQQMRAGNPNLMPGQPGQAQPPQGGKQQPRMLLQQIQTIPSAVPKMRVGPLQQQGPPQQQQQGPPQQLQQVIKIQKLFKRFQNLAPRSSKSPLTLDHRLFQQQQPQHMQANVVVVPRTVLSNARGSEVMQAQAPPPYPGPPPPYPGNNNVVQTPLNNQVRRYSHIYC